MFRIFTLALVPFCVFAILSHSAGDGPLMSQPDIRTEQVDARPTDYDDEAYHLQNECRNIHMVPTDVMNVFNDQTPQNRDKMYHHITQVYDSDTLNDLNKRTIIEAYLQNFSK